MNKTKLLILCIVYFIFTVVAYSFIKIKFKTNNFIFKKEIKYQYVETKSNIEGRKSLNEILEKLKKQPNIHSTDEINNYIELRKKYAELEKKISVDEVRSVPISTVNSVFNKYCSSKVKVDLKYQKLEQKDLDILNTFKKNMSSEVFGKIVANLDNDLYTKNQISTALYYVGLRLSQSGSGDLTMKYYTCAAEKYYDIFAMIKLMDFYKYGSDGLTKSMPSLLFKQKFDKDLDRVYFWSCVLMSIMKYHKEEISNDSDFGVMWKVVGTIDSLMYKEQFKDNPEISSKCSDFVLKKYPDVKSVSTK